MKTFSINEKLKLNKDTKVISKLLTDIREGDTVYFHHNYWTSDTNDRLNKYGIYNIKVQRTIIDPDEQGDWLCIIGKSIDSSIAQRKKFWFKIDDIQDKSISIDMIDNGTTVSTNRSLLEKVVDDDIDKEIEPLQKKIDKLQDKINDLISKKELKYKDIDY